MRAYYGQPALMALASLQPSIDISANVSILFVSSVVVNGILLFFLLLLIIIVILICRLQKFTKPL